MLSEEHKGGWTACYGIVPALRGLDKDRGIEREASRCGAITASRPPPRGPRRGAKIRPCGGDPDAPPSPCSHSEIPRPQKHAFARVPRRHRRLRGKETKYSFLTMFYRVLYCLKSTEER